MWTLKAEYSATTRTSASALALFAIEGVGVGKMKHAGRKLCLVRRHLRALIVRVRNSAA